MTKILLGLICLSASLFGQTKAVVFDFGGVLAYPNRAPIFTFLTETLNISEEEIAKTKKDREKAFQKGIEEKEFWLQLANSRNVTLPKNWSLQFDQKMHESLGIDNAMFDLVAALKTKPIIVGMLSNIDSKHAHYIRKQGYYQPFVPCVLSCDIGVEKPAMEAYQKLLEHFSIPAEEIVFIDDLPENIEAAKKAGIDAILFESVDQIKNELAQRGL